MLEVLMRSSNQVTVFDEAQRIGVGDTSRTPHGLGKGEHPQFWAPAFNQIREVRMDLDEPLNPADRSEFRGGVHALLDLPHGLSMSEVAQAVQARGAHHLKEMLAGAVIPRRHLLFLRGALASRTLVTLAPESAGLLPTVIPEARPERPTEELEEVSHTGLQTDDSAPPRLIVPASAAVQETGAPGELAVGGDTPASAALPAPPELAASEVLQVTPIPDGEYSPPVLEPTREGFSVLVYWLRIARGLGRDEIAHEAGLAGSASLNSAVRGTISLSRVYQLYSYVASLGVDPHAVIRDYRPTVPASEMPITLSEDAPSGSTDSRERKEFVRIVQSLRQPPWSKDWAWFDQVLGYRSRRHTHRTYCTPLAVPDERRMNKLRREYRALKRVQNAAERTPQLPLLQEELEQQPASTVVPIPAASVSSDAATTIKETAAVPEDVTAAAETPDIVVATVPLSRTTQVPGGPGTPDFQALAGLFTGAAEDLQSACNKLGQIAHILPPIAAQPIADFREQLLRELSRICLPE